MIGKLLGHTQVQTIARCVHLKTDLIRAAADKVSLRSHSPPRSAMTGAAVAKVHAAPCMANLAATVQKRNPA
jgi:hypothetical protein